MSKAKVSVIIPVYNAERYIAETLQSVCGQTYPHMEVLCIDDGSTDDSGRYIREFAARDDRIHYYYMENRGVSHARNEGLRQAVGEYVAFVDADDCIASRMLEEMVAAAQKTSADVAVCRYDTEMTEEAVVPVGESAVITPEDVIQEMMMPRQQMAAFVWNRLYRRSFLEENRIRFDTEVRVAEDTLFNYECLCNGARVVEVPAVLYHYRIHEDSCMFQKGFHRAKLTANVSYDRMLAGPHPKEWDKPIRLGCMGYNIMMLWQIYKYSVDIDVDQKKKIHSYLDMDPWGYLRSSAAMKYKLGLMVLRFCPWILTGIYRKSV